jgi:hypothetical protein
MDRRRSLPLALLVLAGLAAGVAGFVSGSWAPEPHAEVSNLDGPAVRRHTLPREADVAGQDAHGAVVSSPSSPRRVVPDRSILLTDRPPVSGDPGAVARDLLDEHHEELGLAAMTGELLLEREMDTLSGHHVRYVQSVHGVPVFGSRVSSHVAHDGRPLLLRADVYPIRGIDGSAASVMPDLAAGEAAAAAVALLTDDDDPDARLPRVTAAPELVVLPRGRDGVLAWQVGVRSAHETLLVFVDARHGGVVRADDMRIAAEGRGLVFRPNPIHSSGNGSLRDQNDRDQGSLTREMELVTLPRLDGRGYLVGDWANLRDSPVSTFRADLDWTWVTRAHHAFEQVNAYYHVDRVQAHLQSLGLVNVNQESQRVDAHASDHDQSIYDVIDDRLEFGDGGVDDAEDGDVIVHEYGHAMQFDQVGSFGLTGEGGAMGEGFCDFLAVVFHESGRPTWDPLFGSWDAVAIVDRDPPYLRRVDRDKVFPDDFVRQVHSDGEIWSRFLMDVRHLIGADDALRVVVESHFLLTPNSRFWQACDALLVANIAVRDGRDDASIRALMDARGLPYTVPSAPLPDEESFEVDVPEEAALLEPGTYPQLLLADDDYVKVRVPAFRRVIVRADLDPAAMDLDLAATSADGLTAALSQEPGAVEELELVAGPEATTYTVRIHHAEHVRAGAYDLTITETELEAYGPKQTIVRTLEPGTVWAFRVSVSPSKVDEGARLKLRTKKLRRGAKTDLRLFAPDGTEVVDAVASRAKKGGKAVAVVELVGDWIGVAQPREGQSGPTKLKVKLK